MKFLYNAPGILYNDSLIIGDTHFGMENKLKQKGIYDSLFSLRLFEKLKSLINEYSIKNLILLGDVKEEIQFLDAKSEYILNKLSQILNVTIVRGNHDGGIEKLPSVKIIESSGFVFGDLGLIHGHAWPSSELLNCKYLVMAHQHPLIQLTDTLGKKYTEAIWLFAPPSDDLSNYFPTFNSQIKLILMPAFNPLLGNIINRSNSGLGPLLNKNLFKLNDALVFRLDGTNLGQLKTLKG